MSDVSTTPGGGVSSNGSSRGPHQVSTLHCPDCRRDGHLTLAVIQSLVRSWQGLGLCIPQGRVLEGLAGMLQLWRERVRRALARNDIISVINAGKALDESKIAAKRCQSSGGYLKLGVGCENGFGSTSEGGASPVGRASPGGAACSLLEHDYSVPSPSDVEKGWCNTFKIEEGGDKFYSIPEYTVLVYWSIQCYWKEGL